MTSEKSVEADEEDSGAQPADSNGASVLGRGSGTDAEPDGEVKREQYRVPVSLLLIGMVLTLVGVSSTWSSSDPTLRRLLDGPTNGWIPLLSFLFALAVLPRFRLGKWPAIAAVSLVAIGALARVTASQALDGFERTWGWWAALLGAFVLIAAAIAAVVVRIRNRQAQPFRVPRHPLQIVGVLGLVLAIFAQWALTGLLTVDEKLSWPPSPDAITSESAQEATTAFAAEDRDPMDVSLEYAWSTAATIEPLVEGETFFPRIFADIEAAQSSVHIIMFGWKAGEVGADLVDLLEVKLAEGVEVRVLVDGVGSGPYGESNELYTDLAAAGAEMVVNDTLPVDEAAAQALRIPVSDSSGDEVGRADHRKLYVIDGQVVWTGGAGIEDHFLNGEFHDVMVRVTGDVVRQAQTVFLTSFVSHDAPLPDDLDPYFPVQPDGGDIPIALLQTVPGGFSSAAQQVRAMIDEAESQIHVMNPYLTDGDIVDRLVSAAERGVEVKIVVSEESNNFAAQLAGESYYPRMIDAGIEVWEYPGAVVHAKLVVVDDDVHFGTLNLDAWALFRDFEVAMVAESPATAQQFRDEIFQPDIEISQLATKPSVPRRLATWVFARFTWFL